MLKNGNLKNVVKEKKLNFILHSDTQKKKCNYSILYRIYSDPNEYWKRSTLHCTWYAALHTVRCIVRVHAKHCNAFYSARFLTHGTLTVHCTLHNAHGMLH